MRVLILEDDRWIDACYGLPPGNIRREPILMRLACAEMQDNDPREQQSLAVLN